jgi:tripartite-type tricarboxylate transporter receptor subunit TctC
MHIVFATKNIRQSVLVRLLVIFSLICALYGIGIAQNASAPYPNKPIHLIVPYPAGGGADYWGQIVARKLGEALSQKVIVDNIPGFGGNNGTTAASKAAADGYTLLLGSVGPLVVHPRTYNTLSFDAQKDFVPIALLESSPILLVVHPSVEASSLTQVIALAKSQPGKLSFSSNGNGSPEQVAGEVFKKKIGADIKHVPFNGAGPARKDLVAGNVSMMFDPCKGAIAAIRQGKLKALGVASQHRVAELPDVPTFSEAGVKMNGSEYELRVWTGILAPKGTDKKIVNALNTAILKILETPEIKKEIAQEGGEVRATSPSQFDEYIQTDRKRWAKLIKESGVPKVDGPI